MKISASYTTKSSMIIFSILYSLFIMSCGSDTSSNQAEETAVEETAQIPELARLNALIEENQNEPELYFKRAQVYSEYQGYDEAIKDMARAMSFDSTNIIYHHFLSDVYLKYPKSYEALLTLQRVVQLHPEDVPSILKLADLHIILKQYPEAHQALHRALQVDPQNAGAYFLRGLVLQIEGKEDEAIKAFRFSTELDADMIDAYIILGQIYQERKDPIAKQFFNNAIRVDTNNIFALHTKANYLQQIGETQEAIDTYRKITKIDMGYTDAYYNTGLAYLELDSSRLAYNNFDIAVKTDPTRSDAYYYRGLTAELIGKLNQAQRDFEQTMTLDPSFQPVKASLARVKKAIAESAK